MRTLRRCIFLIMPFLLVSLPELTAGQEGNKPPTSHELIRDAVRKLVRVQGKDGQWSYDGAVVADGGNLGWTVGSTSIVAQALLFAASADKDVQAAILRALAFVLHQLGQPEMETFTEDVYDHQYRIWGQTLALELLCHVRALKVVGGHEKEVKAWIARLVQTLVQQEIPFGGWSYGGMSPTTFVTAVVAQALLMARSQGENVPDEIFERARHVLERSRTKEGGFAYRRLADTVNRTPKPTLVNSLPGSAGRATVCETTLVLLGSGSISAVRSALNNFFKHWDVLENRRRQTGTHEGKYYIAPYYFYFSHRYAAQAIQLLPGKERTMERERLLKRIIQTRDEGGTWNDLAHEAARSYGTAMVVLALLGDKTPLPPKLAKK